MTDETPAQDPGKGIAQRILSELQGMRQNLDVLNGEVAVLTEVAGLLLRPMSEEDDESPLRAMMTSLGLLVSGTDETHRRLASLHQVLVDPRMTAALRAAIEI